MRFDLLAVIPTLAILAAAPAAPAPTDGFLQSSALGVLAAIIYWQQKRNDKARESNDRRFERLLDAVLQCPKCVGSTQSAEEIKDG